MAFNDAFGNFGHYAFSSKQTHGRSIYESISESMGDSYNRDFGSINSALLYADAMCMAHAQYQLDRALNNRDPSKATELLGQLEKDFQVTPGFKDTLKQRRDFLSALYIISKGNSQSAVEQALRTLIGNDFVAYEHIDTNAWPSDPSTISTFSQTGTALKQFRIVKAVSQTNKPVSVLFEPISDSVLPLPGETYTVDPDPRMSIEKIYIDSVNGSYISTYFTRAHEPGTIAVSPYPLWLSYRRHSRVVISLSASSDPETRRKINELMSRASRGVSQWSIVSDSGVFILDSTTNGTMGNTGLG